MQKIKLQYCFKNTKIIVIGVELSLVIIQVSRPQSTVKNTSRYSG